MSIKHVPLNLTPSFGFIVGIPADRGKTKVAQRSMKVI